MISKPVHWLLLLLPMLAAASALAQQPPSARLNDQQQRQTFTTGFLKGCTSGKTVGVTNQQDYCKCLAKAYNARYDGRLLSLITQLAGQAGQSGPILADVMMAPERKACNTRTAP